MPIYAFKCKNCPSFEDGEDYDFDLSMGMNDDRDHVACPECEKPDNVVRIFSSPAIQYGLSAAEKSAGTTKHRSDLGKFMKDQRTKRQKSAQPGTVQYDSNEYWAGNTLPEGIKAPIKPGGKLDV